MDQLGSETMSRYDWERGTIKVPAAEWKKVRDALANGFNAYQAKLLALAEKAHERLVAIKSARGSAALGGDLYDLLKEDGRSHELVRAMEDNEDLIELVRGALIKVDAQSRKVSLLKPKKKDFALAVSTKTTFYRVNEGGITVDHKQRSLAWSVPENNHAVERARAHPIGRLFFSVLGNVKWSRGSGGTLTSNDEYTKDNSEEGGGANYVTARFGPMGEATNPMRRLLRRGAVSGRAQVRSYSVNIRGRG